MSNSDLQYDIPAIARQIMANDICQETADFLKKQNRFGLAILISFCTGLPVLIFSMPDQTGIFFGIGGLVVGLILCGVRYNHRRKFFKEKLIPLLIKSVSPSLKYTPYKGLTRSRFEKFKLFGSFDRYHSEDQIKGIIGKTAIEASEVRIEKRHRSKNNSDTYTTIFRGVVFIADFNKNFKCRTAVLPDTAEKLFGKLVGNFLQQMNFSETGKLVKLENKEFEKQFAVYSTDQLEARYILTPQLMERLLAVQSAEKSSIRILFENNSMIIVLPRSRGWLEPPHFGSFNRMEVLQHTLQEIISIVKLVEDLDLNTRIWTKQ